MNEEITIKMAMDRLRKEMNLPRADGDYRFGWVANLGCIIYDSINSEPHNLGTEEDPTWVGVQLDPINMEDCNEIAERFLNLAFPPYRDDEETE